MLDGLTAGKYHLVLGAGASAGVYNSHGELPLGPQLTKLLLAEIDGAPSATGVTLQRAFARAVAAQGRSSIEALLRLRYAGCTPQEWHRDCARIPWQAIWTLNVDDSVEYAYQSCPERLQRAFVRLWGDPPTPLGGIADEIPIVHLHGYVGEIDQRDDHQLVFTLEQYLGALRTADLGNWQTRFRGEYPTAPVIVIGARLHEEVDLAGVIQVGNKSADFGLPSFIVRPNITPFEVEEYKEWGLVPISARADQFMPMLREAVEAKTKSNPTGPYSTRYTNGTFIELTGRKSDYARPRGHDFYSGHEPQWLDTLENLDAVPRWAKELAGEIGSAQEYAQVQRLYYLSGAPFSGKSTGLLRLAREVARHGWHPVILTGSEKLDVEETLRYFADRPNGMLFVDGLRPDSAEVSTLLARAEQQGHRLIIVAADRQASLYHTKRVVSVKYLIGVEQRLFVEPTTAFWNSILIRRAKLGRLGALEGESRKEWALHFTRHQHDLYSSLASLEDAAGFIDRGIAVVGDIDPNLRTAFAGIGLFASVSLNAPVAAIAASSGVSMAGLVDACKPGGALWEWVVVDESSPGFVSLRHGYLGELMLRGETRKVHKVDLAEVTKNIMIFISDRVGAAGIRRKDFYYRAASQMMDLAFVQRVVGKNEVDGWYEGLTEYYGWNARFWEQRALGLPDTLDRAYSYAKRAVDKHKDAFTLNTLGTVLMRRTAHAHTIDSSRHRYWKGATDALEESRRDGRGRFELPFLTFFGQTLKVRDAVPVLGPAWEEEMREAVVNWAFEADRAGLRADADLERMIQRFPEAWIEFLPRIPKSQL